MGYYITSKGKRVELEDEVELNLANLNIVELNLSNNINLRDLYCDNNKIKELDLSNNINLRDLYCSNNQLTQLDLSNNIKLEYLECYIITNLIGTKQFLNNKNISINQLS